MKILLFGGAFDPFHNGHYHMLETAIKQWQPDQTFLVPTKQKWWSNRWLSSPEHRLKMLALGTQNLPNVAIDSFEIDADKPQPWVQTLCYFREKYPDSEIAFLIGSDQYEYIKEWSEWKSLPKLAHILVYPRGEQLPPVITKNTTYLHGAVLPISSTMVRNEPQAEMVHPEVLAYINEWGIYAPERVQKWCRTDKRYQHCLRVGIYAKKLMERVQPEEAHLAFTAGVYHDICKEMEPVEQVNIAENELGMHNYVSWKVLHGPVGAWFIQKHFLFGDERILNAIRRHTKPFDFGEAPTRLDKIVFLADKLEPLRTDDDVCGESIEYYRALAQTDYELCFQKVYDLLQGAK